MTGQRRVGFVGLGSMGGALAARLVHRTDLTVFDLDLGRAAPLVAAGAQAAASLPELARRCDTVITCLPTSQHVRAVADGADGLIDQLEPGSLVIDSTSGDPAVTRDLARTFAARGIVLVDAPVSGGPQAAAAGTIAILVGADTEGFQRATSVLRFISPNVRHVGGIGSGHSVKLLNNALAAGHRLLAFEAAAIAAANGVDPREFVDAVNVSSGRSYATEVTMPRHVFGERLDQGFSLGLMSKDLGLACGLIGAGLDGMSMVARVHELVTSALGRLGPATDVNRLIELYEAAACVTVATGDRTAVPP